MNRVEIVIFWILLLVIVASPAVVFWYQNNRIVKNVAIDIKEIVVQENSVVEKDESVKILFVGDMMFDRGVAGYANEKGPDSIFKGVEDLLQSFDLVIGNLEGTITNNESISIKNHTILRFTFHPLYAELLKKYNFSIVSLANNHSLDFYEDGYNQTIYNLNRVGINYFGSAVNDKNLSTRILIKEKNICLVGYHDLYTFDETSVVAEIEKIHSSCDYLTVFAHWGDEYELLPNDRQIMLAHKFIDSGADLIIGAHPHVVEPLEIYKNKAIFYSLGNFVFDQYFSFETEHGVTVAVELNDDEVVFTIVPTTINFGEVNLSTIEDSDKTISALVNKDFLDGVIVNEIILNKRFILEDY